MATFEEASSNDFGRNNRDPNSTQQLLSIEYGDRTVQGDNQCCRICRELACDPQITDKCCNQIFCSKCLKGYLKNIENDITMPCPYCKTKGFTYAPLDMKEVDNVDDHGSCSSAPDVQDTHHQHHQADQAVTSTPSPAEDDIRGYDCDFVEEPPHDLLCKICHFPARDPQQTNLCCGRTFCAVCLHKYMDSKILDNKHCPFCNTVPFTFMSDAKTKRSVRDLKVFCPHKSLGCTWTGELRSFEEHLVKDIDNKRGCPFTELQCSNGCGVVMQRRLVEGHLQSECELREVKCEYCNTTGSYQWINSSHHEECPKYPVECPNHCEVGHVRREEIRGHLEECPLAITKCVFGCEDTLVRRNATEHMKEAVPLHMEHILKRIEQLKMAGEILENEIHKIQTELHNTTCIVKNDLNIVTVNIEKTMEQVEVTKRRITAHDNELDYLQNEIQTLKQRATNAEAERKLATQKNEELQSEIRHVQQNTNEEIKKGVEEVETKLKADLDKVTTELADQKEMTTNGFTTIRQHHDKIVADKTAEIEKLNEKLQEHEKELLTCKEGYEQRLQTAENEFKNQLQIREEELKQQFTREMQTFRDNFDILLHLQDWSVQLNYLCKTCNNVLPNVYVKITEFVLRSRESWYSQSFYTCGKGYKMCISVSSNNNYVSVWALLMSGEYDNHLRWPVKGTLKIQLLNQFYDGNHTEPVDIVFDGAEDNPCCKRVLVGDRSHFGNCFETFITHKSLAENIKNKQNYYKNSTLYFKILEFVDPQ